MSRLRQGIGLRQEMLSTGIAVLLGLAVLAPAPSIGAAREERGAMLGPVAPRTAAVQLGPDLQLGIDRVRMATVLRAIYYR